MKVSMFIMKGKRNWIIQGDKEGLYKIWNKYLEERWINAKPVQTKMRKLKTNGSCDFFHAWMRIELRLGIGFQEETRNFNQNFYGAP